MTADSKHVFFSNYAGIGQILCFSHSQSKSVARVVPTIANEELFLRTDIKEGDEILHFQGALNDFLKVVVGFGEFGNCRISSFGATRMV